MPAARASGDQLDDDFAYVAGLGLIAKVDGRWQIANPIYREIVPRALVASTQEQLAQRTGGRVERAYALGKGALDLLVTWPVGDEAQRIAIEVKLRRDTETEDEALAQVKGYLESLGLREGWLVMFDLRATTPWSERLFVHERSIGGCAVHLVGC